MLLKLCDFKKEKKKVQKSDFSPVVFIYTGKSCGNGGHFFFFLIRRGRLKSGGSHVSLRADSQWISCSWKELADFEFEFEKVFQDSYGRVVGWGVGGVHSSMSCGWGMEMATPPTGY